MPRAVIVAAGSILELPTEVQTVANTLSEAGWQVRLCTGTEATRAGLLAAAGEGDADLAWFGMHSGPDGFLLADGVWPPTQLGTWLCCWGQGWGCTCTCAGWRDGRGTDAARHCGGTRDQVARRQNLCRSLPAQLLKTGDGRTGCRDGAGRQDRICAQV